ncbi:MAG: efflux RND transporter periplasmic adaptor subunit, partial [Bryobacteraceae bacterium]
MKKRIVVVVVVVAVALIAWAMYRWLRRPDTSKIVLSGNIELTEIAVSFKVPGKLAELHVDEGAPVKRGMLIASLDSDQIRKQSERDQAAALAAESGYRQLTTAISLQKETLAADTQLREAEVRQAKAHLDELLAGSRTQEVAQARAALDDARTQYLQAASDWKRAQQLFAKEDISAAQRDQYRTQYDRSAALVKQIEERLALVVEGPRKEQIEAARAQLERAKAALRLSESARLELRRKEQELDARRADIDRAKAQVAVVDSQIDDTAAISPVDGVVLVKSADPGEVLAAGTPAVTIGDIDHPWVRAYVKETDLGRVKLGGKAKVTTDSYPGKVFNGR